MGHDGARWSTLDNQDAAGSMRLPFHSDFSYADTPIELISLQALDLPAGGSATAYASGVHGWRALSAERQAELASLTLRHRHTSRIGGTWPEFVAEHPLRLPHPRTGEPILYLTEYHAERILELEPAESERLIAELKAHLYAPENIYTHAWRRYDLLIWDNLAVQHARPEVAEQAAGRRVLQRVAVNQASLELMVDRAWARMGGRPEPTRAST
jgi:taurine dioxygenase